MNGTGTRDMVGAEHSDRVSDIFERVAAGGIEAFAEFYDAVIGRAYGVVRSVVRDPARSEEVTHEVLLEIWRSAAVWDRRRGSAMALTLTVARRRAIDCVRSEQASRDRDDRYVVAPMEDMADAVVASAAAADDRQHLRDAMEELGDKSRIPIEMAFFGGFTHRQIADHLDLPLGTVKSRIRAGLSGLRASMVCPTSMAPQRR